MSYGYVYVAQIAMGSNMNQTIKAIKEAEAYPGPPLIIGYAPAAEECLPLAVGLVPGADVRIAADPDLGVVQIVDDAAECLAFDVDLVGIAFEQL